MYDADVGVMDWARETGARTEDGVMIVVEDRYVIVTLPDGQRFRHQHVFAGSAVWQDDGEYGGYVVTHGDKAAALRLVARIERALDAGQPLDDNYWVEMQAAYGSAAYQRSGVEAEEAYAERHDLEGPRYLG